ncbi:E3 ubiquitin-protein ligase TRIM71 [Nematostella vectensis]|uniref:E3 ubiquitin-protein ligase TRIM71 n=1 Tax=Nematostella vectensis TaxID=45351 RepID=UPI00138FDE52|nr:E3 ubiquitin-protein ligase TRIM71 [Nematostella vectensis]
MEPISEILKDVSWSRVTCALCKEIYTDPRVTPCLHTFCRGCLEVLASRNPYSSQIQCPICEAEVNKPDGLDHFEAYPPNIYVGRLLEIYSAKFGVTRKDKCGKCDKINELNSYCVECSVFMCEDCLVSIHNSPTINHKVIKVGGFTDKQLQDLWRRPVACLHDLGDGSPVELLCRHCDRCICRICSVTPKKGHASVTVLRDEAEEASQLINKAIDRVTKQIDDIRVGKLQILQRLEDLDKQVETVKREVHFGIDKIIKLLKQHEQEMFAHLDGVRDVKKENLNYQSKAFEASLVQAQSASDFVRPLLQRNIPAEVVTLRAHIIGRLQQLSEMTMDARPIETACVGYLPNKDVLRHLHSSPLGYISSSNTDLLASSANGDGLYEVAVGEEAVFTVTTRDMKGNVCYSSIDILDVQITGEDGTNVECVVHNKEDGLYDVLYAPKTPGKYTVVVLVGGKDIKGSPFSVPVTPPVLVPVKSFGSQTGRKGNFTHPHGVAVSETGEIAVSDTQKNCVHVFDAEGRKVMDIGGYGTDDGQLNYPAGVAFDKGNKNLIVADRDNHRVQLFNRKNGKLVKKFGVNGKTNGQFNRPNGIFVDQNGRMIITDWHNHRVQVFNSEGRFQFAFGSSPQDQLKHPRDAIYHEPAEKFFVSDTGHNVLKVYDKKGKFLRTIGKPGNKKGELFSPRGLAIDKKGRLIVCDFDNHRLQFFSVKDGTVLNSFGSKGMHLGQFMNPMGVALLGEDQLIVTDWRNDRIQVFSFESQHVNGTQTTV